MRITYEPKAVCGHDPSTKVRCADPESCAKHGCGWLESLATRPRGRPATKGVRGAHQLSMREALACVDDAGRVRCPHCGRFATMARLRSVGPARMSDGGFVSLGPHCGCLDAKTDEASDEYVAGGGRVGRLMDREELGRLAEDIAQRSVRQAFDKLSPEQLEQLRDAAAGAAKDWMPKLDKMLRGAD